jgi:hypothetical protein
MFTAADFAASFTSAMGADFRIGDELILDFRFWISVLRVVSC